MKLRIYIFKKQQLLWVLGGLIIVLIAILLVIAFKSSSTFNMLKSSDTLRADLNGDGRNDSVTASANGSTYKISINCSDGRSYVLNPDPVIKTFGKTSSSWPVKISASDVNGDGIQDLILQSSDSQGSILHIFSFNGKGFEKIISGRYSVYGKLKNPEGEDLIMLGNIRNNRLHYSYLSAEKGSLRPYMPESAMTLGSNEIDKVLGYISGKDTAAFNSDDKTLSGKLFKGTFLDGQLSDVKYTDYDIPAECTYLLRTDSKNSTDSPGTYSIKLSLKDYRNAEPVYVVNDLKKLK